MPSPVHVKIFLKFHTLHHPSICWTNQNTKQLRLIHHIWNRWNPVSARCHISIHTLSSFLPIVCNRSVEHGCTWKVTAIGGVHFSLNNDYGRKGNFLLLMFVTQTYYLCFFLLVLSGVTGKNSMKKYSLSSVEWLPWKIDRDKDCQDVPLPKTSRAPTNGMAGRRWFLFHLRRCNLTFANFYFQGLEKGYINIYIFMLFIYRIFIFALYIYIYVYLPIYT